LQKKFFGNEEEKKDDDSRIDEEPRPRESLKERLENAKVSSL
jgi:hypothetical protein